MSESQNLLCFFHIKLKEKIGDGLQRSLNLNTNNRWMRKQQTKSYQPLLANFREQKRRTSFNKKKSKIPKEKSKHFFPQVNIAYNNSSGLSTFLDSLFVLPDTGNKR